MKRARIHRFADGGTSVQANPSSDATANLTKLRVGGTTYGVPTVAANPSGSPTTDLTKVTIGGTDYNVGVTTLDGLTDVSVSNPSNGQALVYDNSQWQPGTVATSVALNDLTDVTVSATPSDGQALAYNLSNSRWQPSDLMTVMYTPVDFVSYNNQPADSVWSVGSGTTENDSNRREHMYDNSRNYQTDYTYFINTTGAATSANPAELIYTPASPQIITEFESWARYQSSTVGNDNMYPATIKVYGYTGQQYVELVPDDGLQTISFTQKSGATPTSDNSLHSMTFNSSKTSYQKYKFTMYDVFNSDYPQNIIIGELNLRGYTRTAAISSLGDVGNVSTTTPSDGQALVYSSNQWVPGTAGGFSCQIFRVTTNQTVTGSDTLIDDYAVPNNALNANLGSYVSVSSGIFSFSKTGFYRVDLTILGSRSGNTSSSNHHNGYIMTSNDGGSNYEASARAITQEGSGGDSASTSAVLSVTDLTNSKVKVEYFNTAGQIDGSSTQTKSFIMFSRIGDAQA